MEALNMDESITVVVTHTVKPGCEAAFQQWLQRIAAEAEGADGYQGHIAFPPSTSEPDTFNFAFRYASLKQLNTFWSSEAYKRLRGELDDLVSEPSRFEQQMGIEQWFVQPGGGGAQPPKYKMVAVVFLALFPLVSIIPPALTPLLDGALPAWVVRPAVNIFVIIIMTYIAMPLLTRALGRWLKPSDAGSSGGEGP
jgi:antibiotic biosynthesis monooxygenase (ABM) superfamily enzyme